MCGVSNEKEPLIFEGIGEEGEQEGDIVPSLDGRGLMLPMMAYPHLVGEVALHKIGVYVSTWRRVCLNRLIE